jgi:hypothetical protein
MVIIKKVDRVLFERIKKDLHVDHLLTTVSVTLKEAREWAFDEEEEEMLGKVNRWFAEMLTEAAGLLVFMPEDEELGVEN